ncbi:MAG TPA: septal ring lytic transglycosylase RlpA family protein [Hyphomicrobiaceae bacterium]|nr:septal ring lytic transglycosylase RlpA family protein [Hyphomicrobiaceae bacterium]
MQQNSVATTAVRGGWQPAQVRNTLAARLSLVLSSALLAAVTLLPTLPAVAKTPGKTYCYNGICHRVKTIAETKREVGKRHTVVASFYDSCRRDRFNPCGLTSSGERFKPNRADNAASPVYPNGTTLLVWNPSNRRTAVVRINNSGPYMGSRKLDLSRAAADRLGFRHRGVARVVIKVLRAPTQRQARYSRNRTYAPVPGYVGVFASIDSALTGIAGLFGLQPVPANQTRVASATAAPKAPTATKARRVRVARADIARSSLKSRRKITRRTRRLRKARSVVASKPARRSRSRLARKSQSRTRLANLRTAEGRKAKLRKERRARRSLRVGRRVVASRKPSRRLPKAAVIAQSKSSAPNFRALWNREHARTRIAALRGN